MRATGAVLVVIGVLAVGFAALSYQGQAVKDAAVANGTSASANAYNITTGTFEIAGQGVAQMLLYGGLAVVAFLAVGLVIKYGMGGR